MTARRRPVQYEEDLPHPLKRPILVGAAILGVVAGLFFAFWALPRLFPAEEQPAPVASLQETVQGEHWSYVVESAERMQRLDVTGKGDFADAGSGDWLVVTVNLTNTSDSERSLSLDDFQIRDANGRQFEVQRNEQLVYQEERDGLRLIVEPLSTRFGGLQAGESAAVDLIFNVRREEPPLRLWLANEDVGIALVSRAAFAAE